MLTYTHWVTLNDADDLQQGTTQLDGTVLKLWSNCNIRKDNPWQILHVTHKNLHSGVSSVHATDMSTAATLALDSYNGGFSGFKHYVSMIANKRTQLSTCSIDSVSRRGSVEGSTSIHVSALGLRELTQQ